MTRENVSNGVVCHVEEMHILIATTSAGPARCDASLYVECLAKAQSASNQIERIKPNSIEAIRTERDPSSLQGAYALTCKP